MAPKKKAQIEKAFDQNEFYKQNTIHNSIILKLSECDFTRNIRDDHPGHEFRKSIENQGMDPSLQQLWMEHPLPVTERPHPG
jgi:hypothetical protein